MDIRDLAAQNDLGSLVQNCQAEFLSRQYLVGISIITSLLFVILVVSRNVDIFIALLLVLGVFLISTAIYFAVFLANKNKELFVYENGFIYVNKDNYIITKYEDVKEIFQQIITTSVNGISTSTQYKYTIHLKNHVKPISLTNIFQDIGQAGEYIQNKILHHQLPVVLSAYQRGENVKFKDITVNQNGLIIEKKSLPWEQIKNIKVVQGQVLILKERGDLLLNIAAIPNIYVFLNLLYEIMAVSKPQTTTPSKGNDIYLNLKISQAEAVSGCLEKEVSFSRWEICDECHGSGLDSRGNQCFVCLGEGQNQVVRKIQITIPPHSVAGDRLTIAGEGNAGRRGGEPGDLYIDLDIQ
ncbi:DUF6585 family protein [Nostoc sp. CMAA1605]|uniref:DUF6585 family protein n=1 Tax=Nostoc sp. CMAA1605 TaxID=2055159 RepID=UPI001F44727C|nr:DUF6585 family protein [Nostoc sp. CMAA1605]MCF4969486.1 hypothetical protein [Nostoc sp. CMAA1605]